MKKVWKIFPADRFEEETRWLCDMANQGWEFAKVRLFCYSFEHGVPGRFTYYAVPPAGMKKGQRWIKERITDLGAESIASNLPGKQVLRQYAAQGPIEFFPDLDSQIRYLKHFRLRFILGFIHTGGWFFVSTINALRGMGWTAFWKMMSLLWGILLIVALKDLLNTNKRIKRIICSYKSAE